MIVLEDLTMFQALKVIYMLSQFRLLTGSSIFMQNTFGGKSVDKTYGIFQILFRFSLGFRLVHFVYKLSQLGLSSFVMLLAFLALAQSFNC